MGPPPSREWTASSGRRYTVWQRESERYAPGVQLSFVGSPSDRQEVMYRGPSLLEISEEMLAFCYTVARDHGFVWVDDGTAWHVSAVVSLETMSGKIVIPAVPKGVLKPLWLLPDARLKSLLDGGDLVSARVVEKAPRY